MATEYTRTNFNTAKDTTYSDGLPAGSTTRSNHRTTFEDLATSVPFLDDFQPVTASGTDTYTATLNSDPTASYGKPGRFYLVKFTNANTGASTINFNSRGAKSIVKNGSSALVQGDISAGQIHLLGYDGTNFQLIGSQATSDTIYDMDVTLTASQISNANSSPVTIVSAPGSGKIIQIIPPIIWKLNYTSAAFATNTNSYLRINTSQYTQNTVIIGSGITAYAYSNLLTDLTGDFDNKAINFFVPAGNPTGGGTNTLRITFKYRILTL